MIVSDLFRGLSPQTGKSKKLLNESEITDETTKKKLQELEYDFFRKQYIPKRQQQSSSPPPSHSKKNHLFSPSTTITHVLPQHQYDKDDEDEILNTRTNYLPHLLKNEMKDDEYDQYLLLQQQQQKEKEEKERLEALKKNSKHSFQSIMSFVYTSLKLVTGESNKIILAKKRLLINNQKEWIQQDELSSNDITQFENSEMEEKEKEKEKKEGEKDQINNARKKEGEQEEEEEEEEDILNKRLDDDPNLYRKKMKFVPFDEEEMEIFQETETILQIYKNLHPSRNTSITSSTNRMKQFYPSSSSSQRHSRPKSPAPPSHYRNSDSLTSTKVAPDPSETRMK